MNDGSLTKAAFLREVAEVAGLTKGREEPARAGLRLLRQSADAPAQPAGSAPRHSRAEGFGGL